MSVEPRALETTEPDAEAILDEIFKLDAQYQGGIIKTRSRTEFYRLHLCPLLIAAFDAEYRRGVEEARMLERGERA